MIEAFIVLVIGAILIVILNNAPDKVARPEKHKKVISKFFEAFHSHGKIMPANDAKDNVNDRKKDLLMKAEKQLESNKLKEAEETFIKVLKIDEHDPKSYKGLGQICFRKKDYKDAYDIFDKLTKLTPKDASNYCNIGMCCYKQKKLNSALKNYEKAISIEKKPIYYKNLGITFLKLKKYDKAAEALLNTLERDEKDKESFDVLLSFLNKVQEKKTLKKVLKKLGKIDPQNEAVKGLAKKYK